MGGSGKRKLADGLPIHHRQSLRPCRCHPLQLPLSCRIPQGITNLPALYVFTFGRVLVHIIWMMDGHDRITDKALIEAVQRGDRDAAACLYHRHIDRVHRICQRIVLDPSLALDCVQEVWLKVFRSLGRFRYRSSFAAWLNSVAANTAIDHYRRSKRRSNRVDIDDPEVESMAADEQAGERQLDDELTRQRIQEALEEISVSQRTAFVLRYYENMPLAEIARILGCREGTVRTHIRRCLLALRAKLMAELNQ